MTILFLSHQREQKGLALRLREDLKKSGYSEVFVDVPDLVPGRDYVDSLHRHLDQSAAVIVLWSREAADSSWVQHEVLFADHFRRLVVPLNLDGTAPPPWFSRTQMLDVRDCTTEDIGNQLKDLLRDEGLGPDMFRGLHLADPYPGLLPYGPERSGMFVGREQESTEIVSAILNGTENETLRCVVVSGPSGVGKSSLIRTTVVPRLQARLGAEQSIFGPVSVSELLINSSSYDLCRVLIVDQFEHVWTRPAFELKTIRDQILGLSRNGTLIVLIARTTFAQDGLDRTIPDFAGSLATIEVRGFGAAELRNIIKIPAQRLGWDFSEEAVDLLIEGCRGKLPLLAFSVRRLWHSSERHVLVTAEYVKSALPELEDIYDSVAREKLRELSPGLRIDSAKSLLLEMVHVDGDVWASRAISSASLGPARKLFEALSPELLVINETDSSVEFSHESVIRDWKKLRRWIEQNQIGLESRLAIERAARAWKSRGRIPDFLWPLGRLSDTTKRLHAGTEKIRLPSLAAEFASASEAYGTRRRLVQRGGGVAIAFLSLVVLLSILEIVRARTADQANELYRQALAAMQEKRLDDATRMLQASIALIDSRSSRQALLECQLQTTLSPGVHKPTVAAVSPGLAHSVEIKGKVLVVGDELAGPGFIDASPRFDLPCADIAPNGASAWTSKRGACISIPGRREIEVTLPSKAPLLSVDIAPDGQTMIGLDENKQLWLLRSDSTSRPTKLTTWKTGVWSWVESEGELLLAVGREGGVVLIQIKEVPTVQIRQFTGHNDFVLAITYDPLRRHLIAAGYDRRLIAWRLSDSKKIAETSLGPVLGALWFDRVTDQLYGATYIEPPKIDDATPVGFSELVRLRPETLGVLERVQTKASSVRRLASGRDAATGRQQVALITRNLGASLHTSTCRPEGLQCSTNNGVYSMSFIDSSAFVAAPSSSDATYQLHRIDVGQERPPDYAVGNKGGTPNLTSINRIEASGDGKQIALGGGGGDGRVLLAPTGVPRATIKVLHNGSEPIWDIQFHKEPGKLIAVATEGEVVVYDLRSGVHEPLYRHTGPIQGVAFSTDYEWFAWGDSDGNVVIVDSTWQEKYRLKHEGAVWEMAMCNSGEDVLVAAGGTGSAVSCWRISDRSVTPLSSDFFTVSQGQVYQIDFSRSGESLAWGTDSGLVSLLQFRGSVCTDRINYKVHDGPIFDLDFSPDDKVLATLSDDGVITFANVKKTRRLLEVKGGRYAMVLIISFAILVCLLAGWRVVTRM